MGIDRFDRVYYLRGFSLLSNYSYRTVIRNDAHTQVALDTNTMRVPKKTHTPTRCSHYTKCYP